MAPSLARRSNRRILHRRHWPGLRLLADEESNRHQGLSPAPSAHPEHACIAPETSSAGAPTDNSTTLGAPTNKSKSAATASNSAKSAQHLPPIPRCRKPSSSPVHPAVTNAVGGDKLLAGYVVLDHEATLVREAEREAQLVKQWQGVYDGLYSGEMFNSCTPEVLGEDFAGWNSSYTGAPIPVEQMREWRAAAVHRIRELRPARVLEIGVGSGLLLASWLPGCAEYWGTDFSAPTIEALGAGWRHSPGVSRCGCGYSRRTSRMGCPKGISMSWCSTL